jgi:hypothetical protein
MINIFGDFAQFSAKTWLCLKTNVMIIFYQNGRNLSRKNLIKLLTLTPARVRRPRSATGWLTKSTT